MHLISWVLIITTLLAACSGQQRVRRPPSVGEPLASEIPEEYHARGGTIRLPCEATGKPEPAYTWMLNGKEVDLNQQNLKLLTKGNLQISLFEEKTYDAGEYQCVASNDFGKSLSQLFVLSVASLNSDSKKEKMSFSGMPGRHLKITKRDVTSVPDATYTWKMINDFDDSSPQELNRNKRIVQDLEGNLYFTALESRDGLTGGRFYKLDVFNPIVDATVGGSYSNIIVTAGTPADLKPALIYPDSYAHKVEVLEGTEMKIQCIFSGYPEVTVTWSGPAKTLGTTEEAGTRLVLDKMTKEAAGVHECTGTNRAGNLKTSVTVDMHTIPKFTENGKPQGQTLTEGDTAVFLCETTKDTTPQAEVKFMINGTLIQDNRYPGERTEILPTADGLGLKMTILNLKRDKDIKVVQCRAKNKYKTVYIDAPLNVLMRTVLVEKPISQTMHPNTTQVVFACRATSDPSTEPTVEWHRDNKPLSYYNDPNMVEDKAAGTLTLVLEQLEGDQKAVYSGEYNCTASNGYSKESHIATLEYNRGGNTGEVKAAAFPLWIILVIVAGVLILLILVLLICICIQRNKGDTYPVDAKERKHGNDPEKDMEEMFFKDYFRSLEIIQTSPLEEDLGLSSPSWEQSSPILKAKVKIALSELKIVLNLQQEVKENTEEKPVKTHQMAALDDPDPMTMGSMDSLAQYGDWEEGRFSEDGSFIGEYQDRKKIVVPTSNTSTA